MLSEVLLRKRWFLMDSSSILEVCLGDAFNCTDFCLVV